MTNKCFANFVKNDRQSRVQIKEEALMRFRLLPLILILLLSLGACSSSGGIDSDSFKLGLILVRPQDDHGWSQAHFEGASYAVNKTGGELITIDKVNPADSPNVTVPQLSQVLPIIPFPLMIMTLLFINHRKIQYLLLKNSVFGRFITARVPSALGESFQRLWRLGVVSMRHWAK